MLDWYDYLIIAGISAGVWFALYIYVLMNIRFNGKRIFSFKSVVRQWFNLPKHHVE